MLDRATSLIEKERALSALSLLRKIKNSQLPLSARADYFCQVASAESQVGQLKKALSALSSAIRLYQQLKDKAGLFSVYMKRGDLLRQQELPALALKSYQSAKKLSSNVSQTDADMGLALCDRSLGRFTESRRKMDKIYRDYSRHHDEIGMAYTLWAMATTDRFLGNFKQGEIEARKSLALYQRLKDEGGAAYAWASLGGLLRMKGRARESGKAYQSARRIFLKLGDEFGLAYSSCGIGNSYRMQNQIVQALHWSGRAEKIYRKLQMEGPLAYVLWSQAQSHLIRRQLKTSFQKFSLVQNLFKKVQDRRGMVYSDLGWGEYYSYVSPIKARRYFQSALKNSEKLNFKFESAICQKKLGAKKNFPSNLVLCGVDLRAFASYISLP